jgi:hypothetical protein
MVLFGRNNSGAWTGSVRRAPRDSAGRGTFRAHVNADQLGDHPTRRQAQTAARAEAARRDREDQQR